VRRLWPRRCRARRAQDGAIDVHAVCELDNVALDAGSAEGRGTSLGAVGMQATAVRDEGGSAGNVHVPQEAACMAPVSGNCLRA
jgi:hypothetical protein